MSGILTKIVSKLAGGGASSILDSIDELFTSDEERLEEAREMKKLDYSHTREMRELDVRETELYLKDVDSARGNQSRVQETEHGSWLSKNTQPILAIAVTTACFVIFYSVMSGSYKIANDTKDVTIYILGILSSILVQIMAYFFGSSKGSASKDVHIQKIAKYDSVPPVATAPSVPAPDKFHHGGGSH